jgi:hypothetical protein
VPGAATFVDRIGRAIVAPQAALADADRGIGGAPDLLKLLILKFVCTELRNIVAAIWIMLAVEPWTGFVALLNRLGAAIGGDLLFILAGWLVTTLAAGSKRAPSRDFELATAAWIPSLMLTAIFALVRTASDTTWPDAVGSVAGAVVVGWYIFELVLAVRVARRRTP